MKAVTTGGEIADTCSLADIPVVGIVAVYSNLELSVVNPKSPSHDKSSVT